MYPFVDFTIRNVATVSYDWQILWDFGKWNKESPHVNKQVIL